MVIRPDTHALVIKSPAELPPPEEFKLLAEKATPDPVAKPDFADPYGDWHTESIYTPRFDRHNRSHRHHRDDIRDLDSSELDDDSGYNWLGRSLSRLGDSLENQSKAAMGILPEIPGKYRMEWNDSVDEVPDEEFTALFAEYIIPAARQGHRLHGHDINHAVSYGELLRVQEFEDVVHSAAVNAKGKPEESTLFAVSIDELGDSQEVLASRLMRVLHPEFASEMDIIFLEIARYNVGQLIDLASPDATAEQKAELQRDLWQKLGFQARENQIVSTVGRELADRAAVIVRERKNPVLDPREEERYGGITISTTVDPKRSPSRTVTTVSPKTIPRTTTPTTTPTTRPPRTTTTVPLPQTTTPQNRSMGGMFQQGDAVASRFTSPSPYYLDGKRRQSEDEDLED